MSYLSREDILKADDLPTKDVDVPEWASGDGACTVRVRGLNGTDRDAYEASMGEFRGDQIVPVFANLRAKLVSRSIVDPETGEPMFNELDIGLLGQKSGVALQRVYEVAQKLSGISDEAVEAAEGNSDAEVSDGSVSPLPGISAAPSGNS